MVVYDSMYGSARFYSQLTVNGRSYTENGLHRCTPALFRQYGPDSAYELTPPLSLSSGIHPETGYEFSKIKIPFGSLHDAGPGVDHHLWSDFILELKSATFMVLSVNDAAYNGLDMLCCWIDGVRVVTQRGPQTNIEINFHVDWWLTMSDRVSYGAGRILRGPQNLARPDDTPPRKWVFSSKTDIIPASSGNQWVVFLVADDNRNYLKYFQWGGSIAGSGPCPTADDVYGG
ncbi:MAG: hypothetical protein IIZ24_00875, partial [Candidatus Methanomethylophilus sp.]|nr:hypothetical protein [Methanomethylophilus sp.]